MSDPQHPSRQQHQLPPYISQQPQAGYPGQQQAPSHAAQGYALNGQPVGSGPRPTSVNAAGRAGLILGIAALGANIITSIVFQFLIRSDSYQLYGLISGTGSLLAFVAALAALILGFIGLRRRDAPQAAAGIAAGIGLAVAVGTAFTFFINLVGSFFYY